MFLNNLEIIGSLTQYIILDLTDLSYIPHELIEIIEKFDKTIVIPIIRKSEQISGTFYNLINQFNSFNDIFEYDSHEELLSLIDGKMREPAVRSYYE